MKRVSADAGLMFIAYNRRRSCNILTMEVLKENMRMLASSVPGIFELCGLCIMSFGELSPANYKLSVDNSRRLKWI
jgi:hypothetical protein